MFMYLQMYVLNVSEISSFRFYVLNLQQELWIFHAYFLIFAYLLGRQVDGGNRIP